MPGVTMRQITKRFGDVTVLRAVDLAIEEGEFVVLVGPSGCGKTTLLRMIAGLEPVTDGRIHLKDRDITWLAPKDRDIAMVFQSYALYPHMSVADNMGFCLKLRKAPAQTVTERVSAAAQVLKIDHLLERRPRALSGGQRQRVAMGRAMVRDPSLYLFDEPLSNLDAQLRTRMRTEIKRQHQQGGTTVVYVTHDQVEAMTLADRIVVMNKGEIIQIGTPHEVYARPATVFVASFIGSPAMNLLPARLAAEDGVLTAQMPGGTLGLTSIAYGRLANQVGMEVIVGIRPDSLRIGGQLERNQLEATVAVVEPYGAEAYVVAEADGTELVARCAPERLPKPGDRVSLSVNPEHVHVFDARSERNLLQ
jgi:multiple sugar transport system ATP-binding protein